MFLITLAGAVIARCGTWIMILGAHLAAVISGFTAGDPVAGILKVSNDLVPGFGNIALLVFALRLSAVIVLDLYGGSLTLISSIDSLKRVRPALAIRILTVVITAAISGILADSQAAALEVPLGTVHSRLHTARRELREAFERTAASPSARGATTR